MPDGKDSRRARLRARAAATLEAGMAASMVLGRFSCPATEQSPAPTVAIPPAPSEAVSVAPSESQALALLRNEAVLSSAPARRVLYTWTTREQIEELARDRVLLTRTESPVHGPAFYDQVVAARAAAGDALAQKLRTPVFARARHAWATPWATLLGWPGETYGDELITVTLKPEAWTLALSTSTPGWKAYDSDNRPVDVAEVLAHPERIGAVYFVQDKPATGYARTNAGPENRAAFREHVLCNEAMIQSWAIGEGSVAQALAASVSLVDRVAAELPSKAPRPPNVEAWNAEVARVIWPGPDLVPALDQAYEASLAFPNENYALTPERMVALAMRLKAIRLHGPKLTHVPTAAPSAVAAASASVQQLPPPTPRKKPPARQGTWARRGGGTF
jgi:hypothetical protein